MKITYLANAGEVHFNRWYKYFIERGHEVHLISGNTMDLPGRPDVPGLHVHYLPEFKRENRYLSFAVNTLQLPRILGRLRRILLDVQPDIVHAHSLHPYGYWGALSGFHPFLVTPIGSDAIILVNKSRVYRRVAKYVLSRANLVTGDSIPIQVNCEKIGMTCPYELVHNGVDLTEYVADGNGGDQVRLQYGIPEGSPIIFYARAFRTLYNVDKIIRAIPHILRRRSDCVFMFASYAGDVGSSLVRLAGDLGISSNVIFTGYLNRQQMWAHHAAATIFLSVPSSDSSPSSVYEAMASGVPTVISRLPWTEYAMKHLRNTYMLNEITPEVISQAVIHLLDDDDLRTQIRNGGLETVRRHFSYHGNMDKMESLMRRCLNGESDR